MWVFVLTGRKKNVLNDLDIKKSVFSHNLIFSEGIVIFGDRLRQAKNGFGGGSSMLLIPPLKTICTTSLLKDSNDKVNALPIIVTNL